LSIRNILAMQSMPLEIATMLPVRSMKILGIQNAVIREIHRNRKFAEKILGFISS
jgi:hypothetical protein